jgi:hypothetical protein
LYFKRKKDIKKKMAFHYHVGGLIEKIILKSLCNRSENKSLVFPETIETSMITINRQPIESATLEVLTSMLLKR